MRRTYVRRSEHDMKRNAEIGLFTKPSTLLSVIFQVYGIWYRLILDSAGLIDDSGYCYPNISFPVQFPLRLYDLMRRGDLYELFVA